MNTLPKSIILFGIDFILIWLWVYQIDPDPSVSIGILLLVPLVFILNLLIAGILYLCKKKNHSKLFLINSIVASIIIYYLFGKGIDRHQRNIFESWEFTKTDTIFSVIRYKEINEFSMSYSLDPGSSWRFLDGKCRFENNEWLLTTDSTKMKIKVNTLIGFKNPTDTIQMKRIER
jgi:hypothetical protein